jgi:propanol-preferring alcohol dehydrogenase
MDLEESLRFAAEGKVKSHYSLDKLENINQIFGKLKAGTVEGRVVMEINPDI